MRPITAPPAEVRSRRNGQPFAGALLAFAALLGLPSVGCDADRADPAPSPAPVEYPAGTVLALDGLPVTAEEVDRWVPYMRLLEPDKVDRHLRRLALSNVVLPVKAAAALDQAAHGEAYREAQRLRNLAMELDTMPADAAVVDYAEGDWSRVGLADWAVASETEVGDWSPVYETIGGFAFFRLIERPVEFTGRSEIRIHRAHVFFFEPEAARVLVDDALRSLPVEIVDPDWEALVPPLYLQNLVRRTTPDRRDP